MWKGHDYFEQYEENPFQLLCEVNCLFFVIRFCVITQTVTGGRVAKVGGGLGGWYVQILATLGQTR